MQRRVNFRAASAAQFNIVISQARQIAQLPDRQADAFGVVQIEADGSDIVISQRIAGARSHQIHRMLLTLQSFIDAQNSAPAPTEPIHPAAVGPADPDPFDGLTPADVPANNAFPIRA